MDTIKQVISASRRTDLTRVFPQHLVKWLRQGWVKVKNPFNQKERTVRIDPESVHTLVLWSKDFTNLIKNTAGLRGIIKIYKQVFLHFTITGFGGTKIEPGIIDYKKAVSQLSELVQITGDPRRVNWRFDPVLFYKDEVVKSNIRYFDEIANAVSSEGIQTVTFSICQWYAKAKRRSLQYNVRWIHPEKKIHWLSKILLEKSNQFNLLISACCTPEVIPFGISQAKCVDGRLLSELHPNKEQVSLKKDYGQRKNCGCTESIDIGSYHLACPNGCVYCYANPKTI